MRPLVLTAFLLAGCAPLEPTTPQTPEASPAPAASAQPSATGPCRVTQRGFAGETITHYTYEAGRRTRAIEQGPSGSRQTLWSYDQGRVQTRVEIAGADVRTHRFFYERGVLVREEVHDAAADQVVLRRLRTYDPQGLLRARAEERRHGDAFVTVDHHALHYADGRLLYELRTLTPTEGPTTRHSITIETDAQGRVSARRIDEGVDGTIDRVSLFDFDEAGHLTTSTEMRADALDTVARYTYDAQGRLHTTTVEDAAGKVVGQTEHAYVCEESSATSRMATPASPNMPMLISKSSVQRSGISRPAG